MPCAVSWHLSASQAKWVSRAVSLFGHCLINIPVLSKPLSLLLPASLARPQSFAKEALEKEGTLCLVFRAGSFGEGGGGGCWFQAFRIEDQRWSKKGFIVFTGLEPPQTHRQERVSHRAQLPLGLLVTFSAPAMGTDVCKISGNKGLVFFHTALEEGKPTPSSILPPA